MTEQKKIAIIGSTGSIGTQALDVVRTYPERLKVTALAAGRSVEKVERGGSEGSRWTREGSAGQGCLRHGRLMRDCGDGAQ